MANPTAPLPQWIVLVEWTDASGSERYLNSELFKKHQAQHDAARKHIEVYRFSYW